MSRRPVTWQQLLEAAERKLDIANYHAGRLMHELEARRYDGAALPPVPVQADFEGVIVSLMAAVDQVVKAVDSGLDLGASEEDLRAAAGRAISRAVPDVAAW